MDHRAQQDAPVPKVIKRYGNRKLYDTEASCYVTLDDITQMVRSGCEVRIIDHDSQEDLTRVVLVQIILEAERQKSHMPLPLLFELIRGFREPSATSSMSTVTPGVENERASFFSGFGSAVSERLATLEQKVSRLEQGQASDNRGNA